MRSLPTLTSGTLLLLVLGSPLTAQSYTSTLDIENVNLKLVTQGVQEGTAITNRIEVSFAEDGVIAGIKVVPSRPATVIAYSIQRSKGKITVSNSLDGEQNATNIVWEAETDIPTKAMTVQRKTASRVVAIDPDKGVLYNDGLLSLMDVSATELSEEFVKQPSTLSINVFKGGTLSRYYRSKNNLDEVYKYSTAGGVARIQRFEVMEGDTLLKSGKEIVLRYQEPVPSTDAIKVLNYLILKAANPGLATLYFPVLFLKVQ